MTYQFDTRLADRYGLNEAVMLSHLTYWIFRNQTNGIHFHDGKYWTYNSARAFAQQFSFWSESQIRRVLKSLEEKGLTVKGNFNESSYDHTTWYSFSDTFFKELKEDFNLSLRFDEIVRSDFTKSSDQISRNRQIIIGTDNKPNNKPDREGACAPEPTPDKNIPEVGEGASFKDEKQASDSDRTTPSQGKKKSPEPRAAFVPPTLAEVKDYIENVRRSPVDPVAFFAHYENSDWRLSSGRRMKDWRLAVITWERRDRNGGRW